MITKIFIFALLCLLSGAFFMIEENQVSQIPGETGSSALTSTSTPNRMIMFSNYSWYVRQKNTEAQGPGPNYFNDNEVSVSIDKSNYLHMTIYKDQDKWYCSEVFLEKSYGYGSYVWNIQKGFELIDPRTVAGLFTYLNDTQQIDVELSQWGNPGLPNTQYAVQPSNIQGNILRFEMVDRNISVIHAFTWMQSHILFQTFYAESISEVEKEIGVESTSQRLARQWRYTAKSNPKPGNQKARINLWLTQGKPPINGMKQEIIVKQFKYIAPK